MKNIIIAMVVKAFNGKVSDISTLASPRHRASITRLFSTGN